jgi:hypothetical protein
VEQAPLDLETVAAAWQRALDADDRALAAVGAVELRTRFDVGELRRSLAQERREVAVLLERTARGCGFPATRFRGRPDGAEPACAHSGITRPTRTLGRH